MNRGISKKIDFEASYLNLKVEQYLPHGYLSPIKQIFMYLGIFISVFFSTTVSHFEAPREMVSRVSLLRRIYASIRHGGFSQIPQLAAREDRGLKESYVKG